MARTRNTKAAEAATTNEKGNNNMAGLTREQIDALLSKTRQKGQYIDCLNEFITSAEQGISVNDTWPALKGKKATTLKQGFESAKDKKEALDGADKVIVKSDKAEDGTETVYLINLAHVEGVEVPA